MFIFTLYNFGLVLAPSFGYNPTWTIGYVLFWNVLTGNLVLLALSNVRRSLSLSLSFLTVLSECLSTRRPAVARPASWKHPRARELLQDLREEERTGRHHLHGSTTMQTLGLPFLLFWLVWGHSCALGGKGKSEKKKIVEEKLTWFRNVSPVFRVWVAQVVDGSDNRWTTSSPFRFFVFFNFWTVSSEVVLNVQ